MTKKVCPECGSQQVQELLLVWHWANTGEPVEGDEVHLAELYPDRYWCESCQECVSYLCEMDVSDEDYLGGWERVETGGGTSAYERRYGNGGSVMLTDPSGIEAPLTVDSPVLAGVYDREGPIAYLRFDTLLEAFNHLR